MMKFIVSHYLNGEIRRAGQSLLIAVAALFLFLCQLELTASAQTAKANKAERIFEAERRLADLGYWITKIDGAADASTRHALLAFQKVEGRKRTGVLSFKELEAIRSASRPAPKYNGSAHVEVDITRQIVFLVDENAVVTRILPISSGSEEKYYDEQAGKWAIAHTPRGAFQITRQIFGVRRAPLGNLYYPNYFTGGVAIHGSASIPVFPASHGCVRIPNFAAAEFQKLVHIGMTVMVYD